MGLNEFLQLAMIDLAGAELRQVVQHFDFTGNGKIAQAAGAEGGPDLFHGQPRRGRGRFGRRVPAVWS